MTHLRKMMLEELERRNYAQTTIDCYLQAVADFSLHFHRPPNQLGPDHIRQYQAHLFGQRKLEPSTVTQRLAALRLHRRCKRTRWPSHLIVKKRAEMSHRSSRPPGAQPGVRRFKSSLRQSCICGSMLCLVTFWGQAALFPPVREFDASSEKPPAL